MSNKKGTLLTEEQRLEKALTKKKRRKIALKIFIGFLVVLALFVGITTLISVIGVQSNINKAHNYGSAGCAQLEYSVEDNGYVNIKSDKGLKVMQLTDVHIGGGWMSIKKDAMAINTVAWQSRQPLAPGTAECPVCHTPNFQDCTAQQNAQSQSAPYGQQAYSQPQGDPYGQQAYSQPQGDPYGQQAHNQPQGDTYGQQNYNHGQTNYGEQAYNAGYNNWGNPYQPPYGVPVNEAQYRQMTEKADNAYILAIIGLILGILMGPLFGWIMGGIALSNGRQAYEITGSEKARSATNIAKWAIGVSTAIFAVALIVCILMFTVFSATVLGGLY